MIQAFPSTSSFTVKPRLSANHGSSALTTTGVEQDKPGAVRQLTTGWDPFEMNVYPRVVAHENLAHRRRFETLYFPRGSSECGGIGDGHEINGVQRGAENSQRIPNGLGSRAQKMLQTARIGKYSGKENMESRGE